MNLLLLETNPVEKNLNFIERYWNSLDLSAIANELISKAISLFLLLIVFYIVKKIILFTFNKAFLSSFSWANQSEARKKTLSRLLESVINYCLYFLLFYWILAILGIPISSLLAGAGITGIAIGLGAQGFLSDLVNGFFILFERQFDVGDSVSVASVNGTVSSIGIRTTEIRGFDGTVYYIPNRKIEVVSNLSRGNMRALIDIPLFSDTDLTRVSAIIEEVNEAAVVNYPDIVSGPNILGPQTNQNGQFVFRITIFTKNGQQYRIYNQFYQLYQEALVQAGISLPTTNLSAVPVPKP
ncbi:mechanosensitive ion channel family protein [Granulicatella sp. s8]|uniref:Mechanosensitive ion channel family protein n=1 Tax=Granulicatella seriolae TaxID=2967226 RepID=A0ABT1WPN7_9LACT|nr:mechanosensitive ion channel family protein [Granulicatella seriolae]